VPRSLVPSPYTVKRITLLKVFEIVTFAVAHMFVRWG
jgi:hypothetical protein